MFTQKRILAVVVGLIVSASLYINPTTALEGRDVLVHNRLLPVKALQETIPLIPAQEFCEALGAQFAYNHSQMTATISRNGVTILLALDSPIALVNGRSTSMPAAMVIRNWRVMIPMEFIASALDQAVYLDTFRDRWMVLGKTGSDVYYTAISGDSFWRLSVIFRTTIQRLMDMNELNDPVLRIGQRLKVVEGLLQTEVKSYPLTTKSNATVFASRSLSASAVGYIRTGTEVTIVHQEGLWYDAITPVGRGYLYQTVLNLPQQQTGVQSQSTFFNRVIPVDTSKDRVVFFDYTVKSGDNLWAIAVSHGLTMDELAAANQISSSSVLRIGQVLKIPQRIIVPQEPAKPGYGKLVDWHTQGTYLFPVNKDATVIDLETGKSFRIRRTMGASHADVETLTMADTQMMREIFGGVWSWSRRPALLEVDGVRYAVSLFGMPHAGVDNQPFLANVTGRSDNWGTGPNYDAIKGNGMDGHFCLYFLNSTTHRNNGIDPEHQKNVLRAAGLH